MTHIELKLFTKRLTRVRRIGNNNVKTIMRIDSRVELSLADLHLPIHCRTSRFREISTMRSRMDL